MSQLTYRERLIAGLIAFGYRQAGHRSNYTSFIRDGDRYDANKTYLFVGTNGALRSGPCISKSYSIGDPARMDSPRCEFYRHVLAAGTPKPLAETLLA